MPLFRFMRPWLTILLVASFSSAAAQEPHLEAAAREARLLAAAETARDRNSISTRLSAELRMVLDTPHGMTTDLTALPLSRVEAPDGTFRLITWNIPDDEGGHRYEGMLLVRNGKRQTLYELRDQTNGIGSPEKAELGPERWYGALYYQVVPVKKGGKTYYTLLGWKGYSRSETRKVVEVLTLRGGKPRFGAPIFGGDGRLKPMRQVYAFSFQSSMMLRHEPEQDRIVMDHLAPARADMEGTAAFLGPDLSYDALVWEKGAWQLRRDIDARDTRKDGKPYQAPPKAPRP